jgi:hypothetical protein
MAFGWLAIDFLMTEREACAAGYSVEPIRLRQQPTANSQQPMAISRSLERF